MKESSQTINDYLGGWTTAAGSVKWVLYQNPANQIRFYLDTSAGTASVNSANLAVGTWYMVTATYDKDGGANNVNLYINLTPVSTTNTGTIDDVSALNLGIGVLLTTVNSGFFAGTIGEVMHYAGKALTLSEVQNIYLATRWRYQ